MNAVMQNTFHWSHVVCVNSDQFCDQKMSSYAKDHQ